MDSSNFNSNTYNGFISNGDYLGAADYLKNFTWKNKAQQQIIDNSIRTFEHEGRIQQAIYNKAAPEQRFALAFSNAIATGGRLPTEKDTKGNYVNPYTKAYLKGINDFGGKNTTNVLIKFNPRIEKRYGVFGWDWTAADKDTGEDGFALFSKTIGMDEKALRKAGVKINRTATGEYVLDIAKTNKLIPKVMQALSNTTTNYSSKNPNVPLNAKVKGTPRYVVSGYNSASDDGSTFKNESRYSDDFNLLGANAKQDMNKIVWTGAYLTNITGAIDKANAEKEKLMSQFNKTVTTKSIVANYIGQDHLNALRTNNATLINNVKEGYDRTLMNSDFTNMKVYSNVKASDDKDIAVGEDSVTLNPVESVKQRAGIKEYITANIKDASYAAAIVGDKIGTMITIPAQKNEAGDMVKPEIRAFVENLNRSKAEETFNNDTALRAQKELASMQMYDYDFEVPDYNAKGKKGRIYNVNDKGAMYDNGIDSPYFISTQDAITALNRQFIIEDGITNLRRSFTNEDGSFRNNTLFENQLDNYSKQAVAELDPIAFQRVAEAYQRTGSNKLDRQGVIDYDYYKKQQDILKSFILNGIGFNN